MKTKGALIREFNQPWSIEEIEIGDARVGAKQLRRLVERLGTDRILRRRRCGEEGEQAEHRDQPPAALVLHGGSFRGAPAALRHPGVATAVMKKSPLTDAERARLLIGPFKDSEDANIFVDDLESVSIDAFSWTSPPGQMIRKLPTE